MRDADLDRSSARSPLGAQGITVAGMLSPGALDDQAGVHVCAQVHTAGGDQADRRPSWRVVRGSTCPSRWATGWIELKIGKFQPEFVSKMNFYLNAVDEQPDHRVIEFIE